MTNTNREFLDDPERWPNWPCQTMKRYSDVVEKNGYRHRDREVATFVERPKETPCDTSSLATFTA